jgi:hypothetical protein
VSPTPFVGRLLADHERVWLREVEAHLRDLPPAVRDSAVRTAEEHVGDRPASADRAELEAALGAPGIYAAALRAELAPVSAADAPVRRPRLWVGAVVVLTIAVLVGGLLALRWWRGWQASVVAPGLGVSYADGHPQEGITRTSTAVSSQVDVAWDADRALRLDVSLAANEHIRVTAVELRQPYAALLAVHGQEAAPASTLAFLPFHPFELARGQEWRVRTTFGFVGCRAYGAGSGLIFDHLELTYEAKGRTRHLDVPLAALVSVTVPADAPGCQR